MGSVTATLKRWRNSIGIVIPGEVAREEGLKPGDWVKIVIRRWRAPGGFGSTRGARPFEHRVEDHERFL